jgi:hypothetical protein
MDTLQKTITDEVMSVIKKTPESASLNNFGTLINKKIDEIEIILDKNNADNQKKEEVRNLLEKSFFLPDEKEVLLSVEQIFSKIEKEYEKNKTVSKKLSEDAEHILADIDKIPPLKTRTLQSVAEKHNIDPTIPVSNIIQKLKDVRDGVTETKKTEEDVLLKKMRTDRVFLREKIKEEAQTSTDPEAMKQLNSELLILDKQIQQGETTNGKQIEQVKEKIENIFSVKKPEEKIEIITLKIPEKKEVKPNTGFSWLKNILSHKEETKNANQTSAPIISVPVTKNSLQKEEGPVSEEKQKSLSVTEEILQQGKEISQSESVILEINTKNQEETIKNQPASAESYDVAKPESSSQKLSESYLIKEGDTVRKILETELRETENFKILTSRQKNFILDSAEATFKKSQIPIIPKKTLNLDVIFKENKDIARILKK